MQEALFHTLQDVLRALEAVTAELHLRHAEVTPGPDGEPCREESCLALSRLEAQLDTLRRSLGLAAFRARF